MRPRVASHLFCGLVAWMTLMPVALSGAPHRNTLLTPMEEELVAEINRVRTDPAGYAAILIAKEPFYRGRRIVAAPKADQGLEVTVEITQEGLPALEEAVAALRTTRRRGRLQLSKRLCRAARDHVVKQGLAGTEGHSDSGGEPLDRIKVYIPDVRVVAENISYGRWTARDVVFHELVDDGVTDRGHRKSLLDPRFESIGVNCGYHRVSGIMCVIDLAAE
jgi:Cysteine-rich secretory protein family